MIFTLMKLFTIPTSYIIFLFYFKLLYKELKKEVILLTTKF